MHPFFSKLLKRKQQPPTFKFSIGCPVIVLRTLTDDGRGFESGFVTSQDIDTRGDPRYTVTTIKRDHMMINLQEFQLSFLVLDDFDNTVSELSEL